MPSERALNLNLSPVCPLIKPHSSKQESSTLKFSQAASENTFQMSQSPLKFSNSLNIVNKVQHATDTRPNYKNSGKTGKHQRKNRAETSVKLRKDKRQETMRYVEFKFKPTFFMKIHLQGRFSSKSPILSFILNFHLPKTLHKYRTDGSR